MIATLIRAGFERLGGEMLPLVSYYPAILVAALMGGAGAGLLAMVLSLAAVWWQFPAPLLSLGPVTREESVGLSLYVFVSVLTVWLAENRRQSRVGSEGMAIFALATSVLVAFTAILLTTLVLLAVDSYLAPDHLVLGYLLPTLVIAMHYGSTLAVVTAFASGIAAASFCFLQGSASLSQSRSTWRSWGFSCCLPSLPAKPSLFSPTIACAVRARVQARVPSDKFS